MFSVSFYYLKTLSDYLICSMFEQNAFEMGVSLFEITTTIVLV